jgi:hypothetical protein
VSHPVPQAPRTSTSASATKKLHPLSTRPDTQVIGIMLLGERINVPYFRPSRGSGTSKNTKGRWTSQTTQPMGRPFHRR